MVMRFTGEVSKLPLRYDVMTNWQNPNGKICAGSRSLSMEFRYRYVDFGMVFSARTGERPDGDRNDPNVLFDNELAVDVGGICWGHSGEPLQVIDHHFYRQGQLPSASAAVLHKAQLIRDRFGSRDSVIFLVSHTQPDFDAFCSMYLARWIIEAGDGPQGWEAFGLHPEGWFDTVRPGPNGRTFQKIDWFNPDLTCVPKGLHWQILLASYASHLDHSRRISCPKNRALHSILYAAIKRGRSYLNNVSGATEFFDEVRETLEKRGLSPLFDSILEESSRFQPELAMLDREIEAYRRDVQRAHKALVHLQTLSLPFGDFFVPLKNASLLTEQCTTRQPHLLLDHPRSQADAIYLKDPECLLFKEWARTDAENSSMGAGFMFTAVAYSYGRPHGRINKTDYFFALDPEKADGRHLYTLWARLQSAEVQVFQKTEHEPLKQDLDEAEQLAEGTSRRTNCRQGFEERGGTWKALFDDPWFDGSNYACTIVATPNRGTLIGKPGVRSDLLDDPVVTIVLHELEYSIYTTAPASETPEVKIVDLPASRDQRDEERNCALGVMTFRASAPRDGYYRFGVVGLHEGVNVLSGRMASQIGETLWQVLNPEAGEGTPTDFTARHLLVQKDLIGIWSRRGVMIAHKPAAEQKARILERHFRELISLVRDVESFIDTSSKPNSETMQAGEDLTRRIARTNHGLALPESRLLSRFFDAIQLGGLLGTLHDLNVVAAEAASRDRLDHQARELAKHTATVADVQTKVEWLEIFIVGFYATELAQIIVDHLHIRDDLALGSIMVVGFTFTLVTAMVLKPWKHTKSKKPGLILLLLLILSIVGLVAAWKLPDRFKAPQTIQPQSPESHTQ